MNVTAQYIKDKDGNIFSPITSVDSIFDSDGNRLTDLLGYGTPIGTIIRYPSNEIPNGYMLCDGSSLPVSQYQELYNVIGNSFGGDTTNFNLPNLNDSTILIVDTEEETIPSQLYNHIIKVNNVTHIAQDEAQIIDNLTSTSITDALSANQGRILDENKISRDNIAVGVDLNNQTEMYVGYVQSAVNGPTNETMTGWFVHHALNENTDYASQIYNPYTDDRLYRRRKNNGTWQDWKCYTPMKRDILFEGNTHTSGTLTYTGSIFDYDKLNVLRYIKRCT